MNLKTSSFFLLRLLETHFLETTSNTRHRFILIYPRFTFLVFGNQVRVAIRLRFPVKLLIVDFLTEQIMLKRSFSGCRALWVMTAAVVRLSCLHLFYSFTLYLPYSFNTPVLHQSPHLQPTVTIMNPRSPTTKLDKCIRTPFQIKS